MNRLLCWVRRDPWDRGVHRGPERMLPALIWLAFIAFPLVDAITGKGTVLTHVLAISATAVFVAAYIWLILVTLSPGSDRLRWALLALLVAVSAALTIADRPDWGFLFTYSAACVGLVVPSRYGFRAVLAIAALAVGCTLAGGGSSSTVISFGTSTVGIGLLLVLLNDLRMRNRELSEARAELARAAVARERERFARDLHDLLGHSLSVIAIKAELAGRLLPDRPEAAGGEVADLEQVARQALSEVREAVSGYRRPTLDDELAGARMALAAAGIEASFERADGTLDPEVEAVLAWTVREGATNVIRHSGARHCHVRISAAAEAAAVEVLDDGGPPAAGQAQKGNGIAGLAERAQRLRGRLEAGRLPEDRGFRLAVSVPTGDPVPAP